MTCDRIREAISARLDGEEPGMPDAAIETHLAGCGACRVFADRALALHRSTRVAPAPAVPDMTPRVLAAIGADETADPGRTVALRISLAVLGVVQIAVAVPELVGAGGDTGVHSSRHLGLFTLALAVGFLYAAWRPDRVAGLLPVVTVLGAGVVAIAVLDLVGGSTAALTEAGHVTELAGLVAVWLLGAPRVGRTRVAVA